MKFFKIKSNKVVPGVNLPAVEYRANIEVKFTLSPENIAHILLDTIGPNDDTMREELKDTLCAMHGTKQKLETCVREWCGTYGHPTVHNFSFVSQFNDANEDAVMTFSEAVRIATTHVKVVQGLIILAKGAAY